MNKSQLQHALAQTQQTKFQLFMNVVSTLNSQKAKNLIKYASEDHIYRLPKTISRTLNTKQVLPEKLQNKQWALNSTSEWGIDAQREAYAKNRAFRMYDALDFDRETAGYVGLIGTGIQYNGSLYTNGGAGYNFVDGNDDFTDTTSSCESNQGCRGTCMAGVVGAVNHKDGIEAPDLIGTSYKNRFYTAKVYGDDGLTSDERIIEAMNAMAGASVPLKAGNYASPYMIRAAAIDANALGDCAPALQDAFTELSPKVNFTVPAGDYYDDYANYTPANCEGAIVAGASTARGYVANYSNYGAGAYLYPTGETLRASGGTITTESDDQYVFTQGTFLGSAGLAGILTNAYELAQNDGKVITPTQMREFILPQSTYSANGTESAITPAVQSAGIINFQKAFEATAGLGMNNPTLVLAPDVAGLKLGSSSGITECNSGFWISALTEPDQIPALDSGENSTGTWTLAPGTAPVCAVLDDFYNSSIQSANGQASVSYGEGLALTLTYHPNSGGRCNAIANGSAAQCQ